MRGMMAVMMSIALTVGSWGFYGYVLHQGQHDMHSRLRPFICVGLSYFFIAVLVPLILLSTRGEKGEWTVRGSLLSLGAGALGAIGALGIIMSFVFKGKPVYVMPLIFGGAPVVNTIVTMVIAQTFRQVKARFYFGLVLVIAGAVTVMTTKPAPPKPALPAADAKPLLTKADVNGDHVQIEESKGGVKVILTPGREGKKAQTYTAATYAKLSEDAQQLYRYAKEGTPFDFGMVCFFVSMTALAWGTYGSVLHLGQAGMKGSKLRPLTCVGLSYMVIAVAIPFVLLNVSGEGPDAHWTVPGTMWSLGAGACGAFGALGIIMAFTSGGKPIYVMPLVFGGAPVVNTIVTLVAASLFGAVRPVFFLGLGMVVAGAVIVLVFAPRPQHPPKPEAKPLAEEEVAEQPA